MKRIRALTLFNIACACYHGTAYILTDSLLALGAFVLQVLLAVITDNVDSGQSRRDYTGHNDTEWTVKGEDA